MLAVLCVSALSEELALEPLRKMLRAKRWILACASTIDSACVSQVHCQQMERVPQSTFRLVLDGEQPWNGPVCLSAVSIVGFSLFAQGRILPFFGGT